MSKIRHEIKLYLEKQMDKVKTQIDYELVEHLLSAVNEKSEQTQERKKRAAYRLIEVNQQIYVLHQKIGEIYRDWQK